MYLPKLQYLLHCTWVMHLFLCRDISVLINHFLSLKPHWSKSTSIERQKKQHYSVLSYGKLGRGGVASANFLFLSRLEYCFSDNRSRISDMLCELTLAFSSRSQLWATFSKWKLQCNLAASFPYMKGLSLEGIFQGKELYAFWPTTNLMRSNLNRKMVTFHDTIPWRSSTRTRNIFMDKLQVCSKKEREEPTKLQLFQPPQQNYKIFFSQWFSTCTCNSSPGFKEGFGVLVPGVHHL